jgi:hypothetical protein
VVAELVLPPILGYRPDCLVGESSRWRWCVLLDVSVGATMIVPWSTRRVLGDNLCQPAYQFLITSIHPFSEGLRHGRDS